MPIDTLRAANLISASAAAMARILDDADPESGTAAGMYGALSMQALAAGHSCLDLTRLPEQFPGISELVGLPPADAAAFNGNPLIADITVAQAVDQPCLFVRFGPLLYVKKFWQLEFRVLTALRQRLNDLPAPREADPARQLAQICLHKPLAVLTGGPGTGKTTTISRALVHWLEAFHTRQGRAPDIILCAPTGKAAARMNQSWAAQKAGLLNQLSPELQGSLPETATTLHRVLGIHPLTRQARANAANPLQVDLLILDEASMIDLPLLNQVLQALRADSHLLLVGDPNQLPSIEAGNLLGSLMPDAAGSYALPALQSAHLHLERNYRQQAEEGLSRLARDCLHLPAEHVMEHLAQGGYSQVDWSPKPLEQRRQSIHQAVHFYRDLAACENAGSALAKLHDRIILTPLRGGPLGCETLNRLIERELSAEARFHGQAILVTENAPHLGLANGDIGLIWLDVESGLKAVFQQADGILTVPIGHLPGHEPAYAMTVHKAQGSEYGHVELILPESDNPLLSKALVYTALTRCRRSLQLNADAAILGAALGRTLPRINGLSAIARSLMEQEIQ